MDGIGEIRGDRSMGSIDAAPGVEPTEAALSRAQPAFDEWGVWAESQHESVVVVTHDAVIRPLLARIAPTLPPLSVPTGSYQVLQYETGTWYAELTDQLPSLLD
jgi:broad specificity phosphatase PhoE